MFYYLKGELALNDGQNIVVDCGGVGYSLVTSQNSAAKLGGVGSAVTVYTYMAVREGDIALYGFADLMELETYKSLISVSGVGPKVGVTILSALTPEQLALAVSQGDARAVARAQGVGPKLAQRIVMELKDKLSLSAAEAAGWEEYAAPSAARSGAQEAAGALMALGYRRGEAEAAVAKLDGSLPVEELVRQALRQLMK